VTGPSLSMKKYEEQKRTGFFRERSKNPIPLTSLIPIRSTSVGMIVLKGACVRQKHFLSCKVRKVEVWNMTHPRGLFKNHFVFKLHSKNGCIQTCGSLGQVQLPSIERLGA